MSITVPTPASDPSSDLAGNSAKAVDSKPTGALRAVFRNIFSFPVALSGLLSALAVLTVRGRFNDPDTWWHLKTGQLIWTTHTIPVADFFSFTAGHHAWIPHEWLPQWAMYAAYHVGGSSGLMLAFCFVASAILVAGYALCLLHSGNAKMAFLGALVVFFFATTGFSIRPQLIGYLLLIFEMILLYLGRKRDARWFFGLPPLFALWINCHGSFFLGIVVGAIVLFSSFFRFEAGSLYAHHWDPRRRRMLLLTLTLSAGTLLLNPTGIRQVLYPLDTLLHQPINLASIEEWQPLQLSSARGIGLLAGLSVCILLVILRRVELYLDELLLLALGTWMAGSHVRMLFVFGILVSPILSRMLSKSWKHYEAATDRSWPNGVLLSLSLLVVLVAFPRSQNLAAQVEDQNPVKAVEFLRSNHVSGPMLNEYQYGGYLIWAAPEYPVFIDGRADLYEWAGVLGPFNSWATLQSDPAKLLDQYGIQFCLLAAQSPMARVLPLLHGWRAVYSDQNSVIFERFPPPVPIK